MSVDPPSTDELFDEPLCAADIDVDPAHLDRGWVIGEAAATFGLTRDDAVDWVETDGIVAVYARIQAHWTDRR